MCGNLSLCGNVCAYMIKWDVNVSCVPVSVCLSVCLSVWDCSMYQVCSATVQKSLDTPSSHPSFFKVIVMALTCDACGYCSNEVKSGAGVSSKWTRITLHLTGPSDLSRAILKVRRATQWNLSNQTGQLSKQTDNLSN